MFRNRKNSQKPDEELIQRFQKTFSDVVPLDAQRNGPSFVQMPPNQPTTPARLMDNGGLKLNDTTPRAPQDLRFTPSFVDPNSISYMNFHGQQAGYYTPNSGGFGPLFHNQAGDLHTPGMSMITPLSLTHQVAPAMNSGGPTFGLDHFDQQYMHSHFHNPQSFAPQASFAPSAFVHRDSGYDAMDESVDELSLNDLDMQGNQSSQFAASTTHTSDHSATPGPSEQFRYHVTLRAPTAMVKHQNEIPISYLNKGQAYSVSVMDSNPPPANGQPVTYRTFIRVSFQEEEQRSKPGACWQLWKEGRGSSEAYQRGGKLQAVEYVDPIQGGIEDPKQRQIQLESASFDGFCVTWTANPASGLPECSISVRFNFLSTDFSHSKGVKGIPVRLCTKTQIVSPEYTDMANGNDAEVCFCKVKLFRDHGAERKLSNDVAHVKKTIEKLRHQIAQAEMGAGNYGKRKRAGNSTSVKNSDQRPSKISKHKRTWSVSSQDGEKLSLEDDLHTKLATMQDMFTSTRPVSILGLRGDEQDDPDLYPVVLPGDSSDQIKKENAQKPGDPRLSIDASAYTLSPTSSNVSINSPCHPAKLQQQGLFYDSGYQGSLGNSRENSRPGSEFSGEKTTLKHPIKVQRLSGNSTMPMGYIEAVDIDPTYRPPAERVPKPIACFYIRFPAQTQNSDDYYRAVYLTERTVRDLMEKISMKQKIDPQRIVRVLHVKQNGLKIMVDDDVVRELPDGQDMVVEISEATAFDNAVANSSENLRPGVEVKLSY
ncbi:grainyhead-like protein [Aspergillus clavatus NRRL 1]|uniref:CP2 transcription factor, putative n=1 Tax=Aspergillus clavatus (strain ATCC 1007 / CBS 513.65 / DSM 816 / NCTC 3887 / NRRL 1 / QM 1276 / 107) TaxID=344612 RepID=A1CKM0_ASPCL|nr:CP2 transcription factor, putative [Aspergillus clavatus NRRL 1]EAW09694.1 CP2 transcription factor, putative [Aspergillus clavatus NRRL 1]